MRKVCLPSNGAAANITDSQLLELKNIQDQLEDAYVETGDERTVPLNFHRGINVAMDSLKFAQLMSQITRYAPEFGVPHDRGLS
ncbi:hypothetical protein A8144_04490 [Mycobacterium leprae 3125609]|nr:hypothetical protein A8144_04490 [Mycobacterium leprae 3125609]OAX71812.1 hypothetical protein A3216_03180 [Mycobacterium leprae 7935681]